MISSAVAIPENPPLSPPTHQAQSTSLKRRQSSISNSSDVNKRPRLHTDSSNNNAERSPTSPRTVAHESSPTNTTAPAPGPPGLPGPSPSGPARQRSIASNDEKSRNRRLFGSILGTLAQPAAARRSSGTANASTRKASHSEQASSTTTTPADRRSEIESRQRERLRRESEEISQQARRKKDDLDRIRRVEQVRWDEQGLRIKHANMRAKAGFLRTDTEPRLYYRPWELRGEERRIIERQKADVEAEIAKEIAQWESKMGRGQEEDGHKARTDHERSSRGRGDHSDRNGSSDQAEHNLRTARGDGSKEDSRTGNGPSSSPVRQSEVHDDSLIVRTPPPPRVDNSTEARPQSSRNDDDHGGEELEQGQEDDVIY